MASLAIEADQRHRRFHAEIARRADLVPQRAERPSYSIPNTPFGVKKIPPMLPRKVIRVVNPEMHYHCMWFADLIAIRQPRPPGPPTIEIIQRAVCRNFGISKIDIVSERRTHDIVIPRQIAMCIAKQLTGRSLPEIGRRFGNRDHTTVLHAVRKIEARCISDVSFCGKVEAIKAELRA